MAKHSQAPRSLPDLPKEPVSRLVQPIVGFMHIEASSGVVLLLCTIVALVAANTSAADSYLAFWKTKVGLQIGEFEIRHSLQHWVNDGLMAIFFFVIGLEVKSELVFGQLRKFRSAALPIAAALGGMVVPAAIFLSLQYGEPTARGWGIPMATDIAFVVGCMAILGSRTSHGLRVLLLSLAIVDDIGAILVIAIWYTASLNYLALACGAGLILVIVACARLGVRSIGIYTLLGAGVWFCFHESGVHATIAGVILGLLTPARSWVSDGLVGEIATKASQLFYGKEETDPGHRYAALRHMETAVREAISPLERLEDRLHPWVSFFIMPVFALANAGVPLSLGGLTAPVAVAVALGLLVGKPVGILLFSWLAVTAGVARLPEGVNWRTLAGGGLLAGIGFTMALFIAGLALDGDALGFAKVGILVGSVISAAAGMTLLLMTPVEKDAAEEGAASDA